MVHRIRPFSTLPLLACLACTAAPAPQMGSQAGEAPPPATSLLCHPGATVVAFAQLGLPPGSLPVDMALTPESVWILFQPVRLVRISRTPGQVRVASRTGAPGEEWTAMDADRDGSVWIVAKDFGLYHFGADLTPRGKVPLGREVLGEGGIARLLAGGDTLYAQPSCGEYGIWRIGLDGKVAGTDFRAPQPAGAVDPATMNCARVALVRDAEGGVVAWDEDQGKAFRAGPGGTWEETGADPFRLVAACDPYRKSGGAGVGTPIDFCDEMIYWGDRLLLLHTIPGNSGPTSRLLAVENGEVREFLETCFGDGVTNLAADGRGYAALTSRAIAFGDFASVPALP